MNVFPVDNGKAFEKEREKTEETAVIRRQQTQIKYDMATFAGCFTHIVYSFLDANIPRFHCLQYFVVLEVPKRPLTHWWTFYSCTWMRMNDYIATPTELA